MAAYDLLSLVAGGTHPKKLPSADATIDFLSIKVGASGLEIKETTGHFDFGAKKLTSIADGVASDDAASYGQLTTGLSGKIDSSEKGANSGVATLDSGGKVPVSQLPNSVMEYKGTYNATTNSPTLVDGTGNTGDVYRVATAGSQDFGSGSIAFVVGDYAIYNGSVWEKAHSGADAVVSVNGASGVVVLSTSDIAEGTNLYYTAARFNTAFAAKSTTDLAEGSNLYYTAARFNTAFSGKSTTDLAEGTNQYFTTARAKAAAVADALVDGVTDVAPSQNAVFDALALKADAASVSVLYDPSGTWANKEGGAITVRQVVYQTAAGEVQLAQASDAIEPFSVLRMVKTASVANNATTGEYWKNGAVVSGFTSLDITKPIYLSRSSAGGFAQDLTGFVAGEQVVMLGRVLSATSIELDMRHLYEF